jgi:diadenosine tetraphosphate (Ap4A) HIT family hydrolase
MNPSLSSLVFEIDPRIDESSVFVTDLIVSQLRLQNDSRYPWFLLLPRKRLATELFDLSSAEQTQLMSEIISVSAFVKNCFQSYKINVATLGNVVPQLHIHVVGRNLSDATWPDPVFGRGAPVPYDADALFEIVEKTKHNFTNLEALR